MGAGRSPTLLTLQRRICKVKTEKHFSWIKAQRVCVLVVIGMGSTRDSTCTPLQYAHFNILREYQMDPVSQLDIRNNHEVIES